ncbi:MAG: lipoprotein-releasing ABC transporter ATP-binding protein LolD [Gammaproteobacteria bacterium]|nr:lipoprotein-releasing ABC transporter ATP-binding protein LolD [Gammaproteobacteria bacterium]
MSNIIECKDLCKVFKESKRMTVDVLHNINFSVQQGERLAIVGASGSGKSTLLHLLGGLDKPTSGQVLVNNTDLAKFSEAKKSRFRNANLGFVYQFHHLLPEFTALENVAMPLLLRGDETKDAKELAADMLEKVGLKDRVKHKPGELSGGERQRAAIARALVTNPKCVLADEPTGNLDSKTAGKVFEMMMQLNAEFQTSFVVVTHDQRLASNMDKVFTIESGNLYTDRG